MHLVRLTYYSENRLDPIAGSVLEDLQTILGSSKRNNGREGISGLLAFDSLWFYQVLEGDRETVWALFKRIMDDPRHGDVTLMECTTIETRVFGEWSMRLVMRNADNQSLFAPYMVGDVVRPSLMTGTDMLRVLVGMKRGVERARTPASLEPAA